MKAIRIAVALLGAVAGAQECKAQFGGGGMGNAGGSGGSAAVYDSRSNALSPLANERAKRGLNLGYSYGDPGSSAGFGASTGRRPAAPSIVLDAGVLMNVKADEYVAVFGVSQEAPTVAGASEKMEATLAAFKKSLSALGVRESDADVDFVAQVRVYDYKIEDQVATEELTGFELRKNISIRFADKDLLDKMAEAAARESIYDLIKVDSVVRDTQAVQERLRAEAARILERKARTYASMPNARRLGAPLLLADSPSIYYPIEQYSSYTASESETVSLNGSYSIRRNARKGRTSYFNPLTPGLFDKVINPTIIEPVIQFTAYLRVRYELGK